MIETLADQTKYSFGEIGVFLQDVVSVIDFSVDIVLDDFQDDHDFFVLEGEHRPLLLGVSLSIDLSDAFVHAGEFGIAVVLLDQGAVAKLDAFQTLYDFVQRLRFFVELGNSVDHKASFPKPFGECLAQRNEFRIVLVYILREGRDRALPFFFQLHSAGYQVQLLLSDF